MSVNNDNIKIFSEKNWLLLCKRPFDYVYMNTLDNQYYSIKETKTLKNIAPLMYSFSISTGMIFYPSLTGTYQSILGLFLYF